MGLLLRFTKNLLTLLLLLGACMQTTQAEWFSRKEPIMGTRVFVEIWQDDPERAQLLLQQAMDEMERINLLTAAVMCCFRWMHCGLTAISISSVSIGMRRYPTGAMAIIWMARFMKR